MTDFDGVVIGAGHNGLALAAYLSRAGLRVAVLERNSRIGGGSSTEERILPGYRLNLHANFYMGIGFCPLLRDLELHRYGFSYIEPPVQQAAVFRDGTGIVIYKDLDRSCASLARFSRQDAETFRALWHTYCEEMRPLLVSLLYNAPMPREQLVDRLSGPKAKELLSHAQHDLFSVVRKHFVDERIRTLFTSYMEPMLGQGIPVVNVPGGTGATGMAKLLATPADGYSMAIYIADSHEDDDPGTTWNADARKRDADRMSPRQAWRAIQAGLPKDAIISSDIGNNCAIGNAYPTFDKGRKYLAPGLFGPCGYGFPSIIGAKIGNPDTPCIGFAGDGAFGISMNEMSSIGREEWPGVTMVVFRNYQWGAEKRNSILWFDDNFVGTELDPHLSYAKVAEACGLKGVVVKTPTELTEALRQSCEAQKKRVTTFIEVVLNQELGEPFRRDAMPVQSSPGMPAVTPPNAKRLKQPESLSSIRHRKFPTRFLRA